MKDQQPNEPQKSSVDFLLDEYRYFADSFWKNEETGEKRLTVFVTLVAAVIAGLVTLHTKDALADQDQRLYITIYALLALLFFGIATLLRMQQRNRVSDEYKRGLDIVRDHFRGMDNRLYDHQPFPKGRTRKRLTGGYVETVALINSLISAALIALLLRSIFPPWIPVTGAGLGLILSFVVQIPLRGTKRAKEHQASAEVRWFFEGSVPKVVAEWFKQSNVPAENECARVDIYLSMPGNDHLGIKLREGRLEIKQRKLRQDAQPLRDGVEGHIEEWVKWSFKSDSDNDAEFSKLFISDGTWISVKKCRQLKKYEVTSKDDVEAVNPSKLIEQGCNLELTEIVVHDQLWWSLGFEAFGKADPVKNLRLVYEQVLLDRDFPRMEAKDSYGYPAWLGFVLKGGAGD